AQRRHALALHANRAAGLGALRHLHRDLAFAVAVLAAHQAGRLDVAAQGRDRHRHRHRAEQVQAVALEQLVRAYRDEDVEIAARAAARARVALAGEADARAVVDTRRDAHRQRALL